MQLARRRSWMSRPFWLFVLCCAGHRRSVQGAAGDRADAAGDRAGGTGESAGLGWAALLYLLLRVCWLGVLWVAARLSPALAQRWAWIRGDGRRGPACSRMPLQAASAAEAERLEGLPEQKEAQQVGWLGLFGRGFVFGTMRALLLQDRSGACYCKHAAKLVRSLGPCAGPYRLRPRLRHP